MDYEFFLSYILHIYKAKVNVIPENNFLFKLGYCQNSRFFDALSKRHHEENTLLLLGIRKSPFIKLAPREYIMGDNAFLLEKTYYQFINDFWFDCIKQIMKPDGKNLIPHQQYFADVGLFFEEYLLEILTNSFKNYPASVLLTFDQLKLTGAHGEFELCDIYFRADRKVIIGQAKATGIYDEAKYGGDIGKLYKEDRPKFFKSFGVDQIVKSIKDLSANIHLLDADYPSSGECEIYECHNIQKCLDDGYTTIFALSEDVKGVTLMTKALTESGIFPKYADKVRVYDLTSFMAVLDKEDMPKNAKTKTMKGYRIRVEYGNKDK